MDGTIQQKLDALAEYRSQKDTLELKKRELLDEVKIPAEIEQIVSEGMKRTSAVDANIREASKALDAVIDAKLAAVVIPREYQDELAAIEKARAEILAKMGEVEAQKRAIRNEQAEQHASMFEKTDALKKKIREEIDAQTHQVYADIAQRKLEIEAEFSGKADDVDANCKKLEEEIKVDMQKQAAEKLKANPKCKDLSVKGSFLHAVYGKPRKTWIPAKLDDYTETHPDIKNCYTEGDPTITIRPI